MSRIVGVTVRGPEPLVQKGTEAVGEFAALFGGKVEWSAYRRVADEACAMVRARIPEMTAGGFRAAAEFYASPKGRLFVSASVWPEPEPA